DRIDRKKHRAGLGESHEHRLMSWDVAARLNQFNSRQQPRVPINEPVAEAGIAPLLPCLRETRMPGFRHLVVSSLDDNLRVGERSKIARVVPIEVCGD